MYKIFKIITIVSIILSCTYTPSQVSAQNYHGGYSKKSPKKEDKAARPIPGVFSSQISSVQQGQKLDIIYNNLFVSLWFYAGVNFVHQKKLSAKVQPEKFQFTRYKKEFSGDLAKAMGNLNNNYSSMLADIENAEQKYIKIREGVRAEDHKKLDALWKVKIEEFRAKADTYFQLQNKFLNTYRTLVSFILKQSGSYYYKSNERKVYFYKFGGYKFYGQSIDKLRMISFNQRKLLRENAPAGVDPDFK